MYLGLLLVTKQKKDSNFIFQQKKTKKSLFCKLSFLVFNKYSRFDNLMENLSKTHKKFCVERWKSWQNCGKDLVVKTLLNLYRFWIFLGECFIN